MNHDVQIHQNIIIELLDGLSTHCILSCKIIFENIHEEKDRRKYLRRHESVEVVVDASVYRHGWVKFEGPGPRVTHLSVTEPIESALL